MVEKNSILVGEISGVFGLKGWVKVFSFTKPRENILNYSPWVLRKGNEQKQLDLIDGQRQGKNIVAHLKGITDRDGAAELMGWQIFIDRSQLPESDAGEYYWADLIGLQVKNQQGEDLGVIDHLLETGANDVLVVIKGDQERLIPFLIGQTVQQVDLPAGKMVVDWDLDF